MDASSVSATKSNIKGRLMAMMKQKSEPDGHGRLLTPETMASKIEGIAQHPVRTPPSPAPAALASPLPPKKKEEEAAAAPASEDDEDLLDCIAPASPVKKLPPQPEKKKAAVEASPPPPREEKKKKKKSKFILDEAEGSDEAEEEEDEESKDMNKYDSKDSIIASENSIDEEEDEDEDSADAKKSKKKKAKTPKPFAEQDAAKEARIEAMIKKYNKGEVVGRKQVAEAFGLKGVGKVVLPTLSDGEEDEDAIRERDKKAILGDDEEEGEEEEKLDANEKLPETRHSSASSSSSDSESEEGGSEAAEEEEKTEEKSAKAKAEDYDAIEFSKEEDEGEEEGEKKQPQRGVADAKKAKVPRQEVVASVVAQIEKKIKDAHASLAARLGLVKPVIENFVEAIYQATILGEASTDASSARSQHVLETCANLMKVLSDGFAAIQDRIADRLNDAGDEAVPEDQRYAAFAAFAGAFFRMQIVRNVTAAVDTRCIVSRQRIAKGSPINVLLVAHRVPAKGPKTPARPTVFYYPVAILDGGAAKAAPPTPPPAATSTKSAAPALQAPEEEKKSPVEPIIVTTAATKTLPERLAKGETVAVFRNLKDIEYWLKVIQFFIDAEHHHIEIAWKPAGKEPIIYFDAQCRPNVTNPNQPWPKLATEQLMQALFEILPHPNSVEALQSGAKLSTLRALGTVATPQTGQLYYQHRADVTPETVAYVEKGLAKLDGEFLAFLLGAAFDGPSVVMHSDEAIVANPAVQMMRKNLTPQTAETTKLFEVKAAPDQPELAPRGSGSSGAARRRFYPRLFCHLFGYEVIKRDDFAKPRF